MKAKKPQTKNQGLAVVRDRVRALTPDSLEQAAGGGKKYTTNCKR